MAGERSRSAATASLVVAEGLFTEEEIDVIEKDAYAAIEAARVFAEESAEPSLETIEEGVYAP